MNQSPQKRDAQFNQAAHQYRYQDDDISLVDLAKTLIKRRNWLFTTFILGLIVTLLAAWLKQPPTVNSSKAFTTLFAVGYKSSRNIIEPLSGIETQLNDAFIPLASTASPFTATVSIENRKNIEEDGSNIIKIITQATSNKKEDVASYHQAILFPLLERHQSIIKEINKGSHGSFTSDDPIQLVASSIASLAQPLNIENDASKNKTILIIALGLIFSVMLAIVSVFLREFASQVCSSIKNDAEK